MSDSRNSRISAPPHKGVPRGNRVLVCGSRSYSDKGEILSRLKTFGPYAIVMHGGARGADRLAGEAAEELGYGVEEWPADWEKHGKRAGILRNLAMLDAEPDCVLAFWDGQSPGTAHTIREARKREIYLWIVPDAVEATP